MQNAFADHRFFALQRTRLPTHQLRKLSPQGIHPLRVEDPMLWLLGRFGLAPRAEGPAGDPTALLHVVSTRSRRHPGVPGGRGHTGDPPQQHENEGLRLAAYRPPPSTPAVPTAARGRGAARRTGVPRPGRGRRCCSAAGTWVRTSAAGRATTSRTCCCSTGRAATCPAWSRPRHGTPASGDTGRSPTVAAPFSGRSTICAPPVGPVRSRAATASDDGSTRIGPSSPPSSPPCGTVSPAASAAWSSWRAVPLPTPRWPQRSWPSPARCRPAWRGRCRSRRSARRPTTSTCWSSAPRPT